MFDEFSYRTQAAVMYRDLFEVLVLQILQGVNKVLFDTYVQGVLHIRHLPHGLTHIHQSTACRTERQSTPRQLT